MLKKENAELNKKLSGPSPRPSEQGSTKEKEK